MFSIYSLLPKSHFSKNKYLDSLMVRSRAQVQHHHVLLIAMVFAASTCNGDGDVSGLRTYVTIFNRLGKGVDLTLHCKSGDDDLGEQVVRYSESWYFSFYGNFWGTTLFYCSFKWEDNEVVWFDIYIVGRDATTCGYSCRWYIYPSNPCLVTYNAFTCYPWSAYSSTLSLGPSSV